MSSSKEIITKPSNISIFSKRYNLIKELLRFWASENENFYLVLPYEVKLGSALGILKDIVKKFLADLAT